MENELIGVILDNTLDQLESGDHLMGGLDLFIYLFLAMFEIVVTWVVDATIRAFRDRSLDMCVTTAPTPLNQSVLVGGLD